METAIALVGTRVSLNRPLRWNSNAPLSGCLMSQSNSMMCNVDPTSPKRTIELCEIRFIAEAKRPTYRAVGTTVSGPWRPAHLPLTSVVERFRVGIPNLPTSGSMFRKQLCLHFDGSSVRTLGSRVIH
jgi:hypothetical protein